MKRKRPPSRGRPFYKLFGLSQKATSGYSVSGTELAAFWAPNDSAIKKGT